MRHCGIYHAQELVILDHTLVKHEIRLVNHLDQQVFFSIAFVSFHFKLQILVLYRGILIDFIRYFENAAF